jgi:hypothetical protein
LALGNGPTTVEARSRRALAQRSPAERRLSLTVTVSSLPKKNALLTWKVAPAVRPASFRSTRGTTLIAVVADELAWWKDENSALPDVEILRALRPGLMTTKGPLIAISSPFGSAANCGKPTISISASPRAARLSRKRRAS